jgi:hypothetical protein
LREVAWSWDTHLYLLAVAHVVTHAHTTAAIPQVKDPLNSAFLDGGRAAPHPRRVLPCESPTDSVRGRVFDPGQWGGSRGRTGVVQRGGVHRASAHSRSHHHTTHAASRAGGSTQQRRVRAGVSGVAVRAGLRCTGTQLLLLSPSSPLAYLRRSLSAFSSPPSSHGRLAPGSERPHAAAAAGQRQDGRLHGAAVAHGRPQGHGAQAAVQGEESVPPVGAGACEHLLSASGVCR